MKRHHTLIASLISAAALAASAAAFAQPGSGMGGGMGSHRGPGMGPGGSMGMAMHGDAATVGSRLSAIKAELKITPAQEASWTKFETYMAQQAATRQAAREQMRTQMQTAQADGSKSDFTAMRANMQKVREAHQADHRAAFQELYAVLTPEQKAIADQRMNRRGPQHRWN